jgi:hypothetical protein
MTGQHERQRSQTAEVRGDAYKLARVLGDVRAIQTGTVGRRARNRLVGRLVARALRGIMR